MFRSIARWWRIEVSGTVDQAAVIAKRRAECDVSARYLLMTCMSAGIAILGMLLSSPAVVIGAMLLSPLMDPIMGVGFALAIGDFHWLRRSVRSLALGVVLAILFCAIIVVFSPIQTVTTEIASRTRPNLFDLLVAIFSAIAGGYAVIRGREGTIVGVAIATALMPPLAAVGYGLATWNGTVFSGALLLFVTNLTAIALTATAMARGYGFSTSLSEKQSQLQAFLIFAAFVALAVATYFGINPPSTFIAKTVAFAFGLAASSFFPTLLLGIFSKKMSREGAIAGMICGIGFTLGYIIYFQFLGGTKEQHLFGISPEGIGTIGMLINFAVAFSVNLFSPPPPQEVQDMVESIHIPTGAREATPH